MQVLSDVEVPSSFCLFWGMSLGKSGGIWLYQRDVNKPLVLVNAGILISLAVFSSCNQTLTFIWMAESLPQLAWTIGQQSPFLQPLFYGYLVVHSVLGCSAESTNLFQSKARLDFAKCRSYCPKGPDAAFGTVQRSQLDCCEQLAERPHLASKASGLEDKWLHWALERNRVNRMQNQLSLNG